MNNSYTYSRSELNSFLSKTYGFMGLAVLVSAISAYLTLKCAPVLASSTAFAVGSFVVSIVIAIIFTKMALKNATTGAVLLFIFSVLEGISFSSLAFAYTNATITGAFISASAIFMGMALLGSTTKFDLTRFGTYLLVGLLGVIIVSLVNLLLFKSIGLAFILSIVSVFIFTGFAAYDAQQAARSYDMLVSRGIDENGVALINAFNLYLDFINLFIELVQLFGFLNDRN